MAVAPEVGVAERHLADHYGFPLSAFSDTELLELAQELAQPHEAEHHLWRSVAAADGECPLDDANPYAPRQAPSEPGDPFGSSFVLRAAVDWDAALARWCIDAYVRETGVYVLSMVCGIGIMIGLFTLLDSLELLTTTGLLGWILIAVCGLLGYGLGKLFSYPYRRRLMRQVEAGGLVSLDSPYQLTIRRETMTLTSAKGNTTWPLCNIVPLRLKKPLVVLSPEYTYRIYIPCSAATVPETFDYFRKALKRRLRRFAWRHFWRLSLE